LGFIGRVFLGGFFIANPDYQQCCGVAIDIFGTAPGSKILPKPTYQRKFFFYKYNNFSEYTCIYLEGILKNTFVFDKLKNFVKRGKNIR
jgi:hypothetical protein